MGVWARPMGAWCGFWTSPRFEHIRKVTPYVQARVCPRDKDDQKLMDAAKPHEPTINATAPGMTMDPYERQILLKLETFCGWLIESRATGSPRARYIDVIMEPVYGMREMHYSVLWDGTVFAIVDTQSRFVAVDVPEVLAWVQRQHMMRIVDVGFY